MIFSQINKIEISICIAYCKILKYKIINTQFNNIFYKQRSQTVETNIKSYFSLFKYDYFLNNSIKIQIKYFYSKFLKFYYLILHLNIKII